MIAWGVSVRPQPGAIPISNVSLKMALVGLTRLITLTGTKQAIPATMDMTVTFKNVPRAKSVRRRQFALISRRIRKTVTATTPLIALIMQRCIKWVLIAVTVIQCMTLNIGRLSQCVTASNSDVEGEMLIFNKTFCSRKVCANFCNFSESSLYTFFDNLFIYS